MFMRRAMRAELVRVFQSQTHGNSASSEVLPDAHSRVSALCALPAMKLSPRFASRVLSRLGQSLQSLQESLKGWLTQRAPVLVPIPIRADRRTRGPVARRPCRGG
jgi:hypothetical protein